MDLNKLKVNDLKAELASRNLDIKGVKAVLVERLKEAIEKENAGGAMESIPVAVKKSDINTPSQSTPIRRSRRRSMTRSPGDGDGVKTEIQTLDSVDEVVEHDESTESNEHSSTRKKRRTRSITKSPSPLNSGEQETSARLDVLLEETESSANAAEDFVALTEKTQHELTPVVSSEKNEIPSVVTEDIQTRLAQNISSEQTNDDTKRIELQEDVLSEEYFGVSTTSSTMVADPIELVPSGKEIKVTNNTEIRLSTEIAEQTAITKESAGQIADNSLLVKAEATTTKKVPRNKAVLVPIDFVAEEQEPQIDEQQFSLSWYDSHLNLEIDPEMLDSAKPISDGAFALVWAGARANLGVTQGKVAYEVLLCKYNESQQVTDESVTFGFRIGWSTTSASLELGEAPGSFAFDGDGKKGTDNQFIEYGVPYKVNDVVGVYLDLDCSPCRMEFTVNGACQGVAFEFEKKTLNEQALYPHVYSRNIAFKVNFGQLKQSLLNERVESSQRDAPKQGEETFAVTSVQETGTNNDQALMAKGDSTGNNLSDVSAEQQPAQNLQTIKQEFVYITSSSKENLEHGPRRPASRKDCEVIFLIGMPASGKTSWVQNYIKEHTEKRYTILSVDSLLNQMKVQGNIKEPSNTRNWAKLIEQLSKDLSKLNEIAGKRRRNFILDQTNVFLSEQKRRLRVFGKFAARKAVVIVPSKEEYNRRLKLKQDVFGVEVPEGRINIMKANFFIPTIEQEWFTEIEFAELDEEKARESVRKLNEIGRIAHPRGNNYRHQQQNRRGGVSQKWHHGYVNYRYQYQQGGYSTQRYNKQQQYSQNQNFRPGNGYGRRDIGHGGGARYGTNNWTHNNSGRYDNRFANRGYQINQNRRYNENRGNYRGYDDDSVWNQQNTNCWSYGSQNNDTQQWYSWWQSNLKNLLQQHGSGGSVDAQQNNMEQDWSQYAQQHNYGNYQQSKFHGSGSSSRNK